MHYNVSQHYHHLTFTPQATPIECACMYRRVCVYVCMCACICLYGCISMFVCTCAWHSKSSREERRKSWKRGRNSGCDRRGEERRKSWNKRSKQRLRVQGGDRMRKETGESELEIETEAASAGGKRGGWGRVVPPHDDHHQGTHAQC